MIIPPKLQKGDEIRVVASSRSLTLLSEDVLTLAIEHVEKQGFIVSFSQYCKEQDMFMSSSIDCRVSDIHDAFADPNVKAIFTVIGGYNTNQLLSYLDYDLIQSNPKILCGYSDITALTNAITAKTGLVTYSGLQFSTRAMQQQAEYNSEYFHKCLVETAPFAVEASPTRSDDARYRDQNNRDIQENKGYRIINQGNMEGTIIGGNLCTFNLLQGTEYMPSLKNTVLFIEDDALAGDCSAQEFDRNLQSLIHQPRFDGVQGIVIGRFQKKSQMTLKKLTYILQTKKELQNIPIIANADFGHTNPLITFPIGGTAKISAGQHKVNFEILAH